MANEQESGSEDSSAVTRVPFAVRWVDDPSLKQQYVTEATISYVGEQVFLMLGELQGPFSQVQVPENPGVNINVVAKVVLSEQAFHKIATLFENVRGAIRNPNKEEK